MSGVRARYLLGHSWSHGTSRPFRGWLVWLTFRCRLTLSGVHGLPPRHDFAPVGQHSVRGVRGGHVLGRAWADGVHAVPSGLLQQCERLVGVHALLGGHVPEPAWQVVVRPMVGGFGHPARLIRPCTDPSTSSFAALRERLSRRRSRRRALIAASVGSRMTRAWTTACHGKALRRRVEGLALRCCSSLSLPSLHSSMGSYQPWQGATACLPCPPGSFSPTGGRAECTPCEPGSYTDRFGSTACFDCPVGSATARNNQTSCEACKCRGASVSVFPP